MTQVGGPPVPVGVLRRATGVLVGGDAMADERMTDDELVRAFEGRTLPLALWTHRAHVRVAFTYLRRHPFAEALSRMRAGVTAFNAANAILESPTSGYNETTTHAFLRLIAATMRAYGTTHPAPDADAFCDTHPQLMTRNALRLFYSPGRRMHPLARSRFVEPDLAPLPPLDPADVHAAGTSDDLAASGLRPFRADDVGPCAALYVATYNAAPWNEHWDAAAAAQRLGGAWRTPGSFGLVAVDGGGGVAGFVLGHAQPWEGDHYFYVKEVLVRASCQRQGVGSAIVRSLCDRLRRAGVRKVYLMAARDGPAHAFYRKLGFAESTGMVPLGMDLT